ncbi:dynactin subunit 3-like [Amphiura filiformis]|uniref:dynactin subunit 3-like n=1 Tax=Amphiura filiformis TaxID=82378 RepID=UPI003B223B7F
MATTSESLSVLESRVKLLEDRILGEDSVQQQTPQVIETLSKVRQSLDGSTTGKERIHMVWKRLQELNDCLNPEIADKFALTQEAKTEIILAEEQQLKRQAALLEQVKSMKDFIDSEHIKAAPSFADKIHPLATVQLDQKDQTDQHSQEVRELLQAYNDIVTQLSKQFIQWDEIMTRYEVAAQVRKPDDH